MNSGTTEEQIKQIKNLRQQLKYWRWGTTGAAALIVVVSVLMIKGAVNNLTQPGPSQDKFVSELSEELQSDVVPQLEQIAANTVAEVQPEINKAFVDLNKRVPDLAQATMDELEVMQTNLPVRGEKVLRSTFEGMLTEKEAKIREMYPQASEEQVAKLMENLSTAAQEQIGIANDQLFAPHQEALVAIVENLEGVKSAENGTFDSEDPNWEMALLVVDIFRDDLDKLRPVEAPVSDEVTTVAMGGQK
jgi:hypothetical protein